MPAIRTLLTALLAATVVAVPIATAAQVSAAPSAAPYPPIVLASLGSSTTDPCPGDVVTLTGSDFAPGEHVTITAHSSTGGTDFPLATPVAGTDGSFAVRVTTPEAERGSFVFTADGTINIASIDVQACRTAPVAVASVATPGGGGLASTGVQIALLLGLGVLAVAVGAVATAGGRSRRRSSSRVRV